LKAPASKRRRIKYHQILKNSFRGGENQQEMKNEKKQKKDEKVLLFQKILFITKRMSPFSNFFEITLKKN